MMARKVDDDGAARRSRLPAAERRETILRAAAEVFAESGYRAAKVSDVAATADGPIGFSLTTPEGGVIAKFRIDPHTGHIDRVG